MSEAVHPASVPLFEYDPTTPAGSVIAALYALQDAEALFRCRMRDLFEIGANDLAAIQFMARLEHAGREVRPRDIAETLGVTRAAATIMLTRLMHRGLVSKRDDPHDGRGQVLRLTDETRTRLTAAIGSSQMGLSKLLSALGAREARRVVSLIDEVTVSLETGAQAIPVAPSR